jgi:uncharacterized lipoprotein YddW (UPF0748 family)
MNRVWTLAVIAVAACAQHPAPLPAPTQPVAVPVALEGVIDSAREIPPMPREARGVWVASVSNMDWPSRPGLSTDSQQAELRAILDRVRQLRMNLVILQVRPAGDALYASSLEPWSEYLTGTMGKAPEPFYDPLAFAVQEAHARGLELHAWFNPYRARHPSAKSELAASHISRARPDLVRTYGTHLWMDPGEPAVQEHSLRVILDVIRRYDVDGIHIDDYFYPYREYASGKLIDFPDEPSWTRYVNAGGTLARADWRRANVDQFIERLFKEVRATKPTVKFGISPFGIWRPGYPASVSGLDAYVELYADSRKWLNNGWLDYFAPQLYWQIAAPQQSYQALLEWWVSENKFNRHIWPGNAAYRVRNDRQNWPPEEIAHQVALTRANRGASGNIHFNMGTLLRDQGGVSSVLGDSSYAYEALMPRTPWLDAQAPLPPHIKLVGDTLEIRPAVGEQPLLFAVRMKMKDGWRAETIPAHQARISILRAPGVRPELIGVTAVDRHGNESEAVKVSFSE